MLLPPEKAHPTQLSGLRTDRTTFTSQNSSARSKVTVPLASLIVGSLGIEVGLAKGG